MTTQETIFLHTLACVIDGVTVGYSYITTEGDILRKVWPTAEEAIRRNQG